MEDSLVVKRCIIGHISPEAAEGGLIELLRTEIISIDIPNNKLELKVDDDIIKNRLINLFLIKAVPVI